MGRCYDRIQAVRVIISIRTVGNQSTVTLHPRPLHVLAWIAAMVSAFVAGAGMGMLLLL